MRRERVFNTARAHTCSKARAAHPTRLICEAVVLLGDERQRGGEEVLHARTRSQHSGKARQGGGALRGSLQHTGRGQSLLCRADRQRCVACCNRVAPGCNTSGGSWQYLHGDDLADEVVELLHEHHAVLRAHHLCTRARTGVSGVCLRAARAMHVRAWPPQCVSEM